MDSGQLQELNEFFLQTIPFSELSQPQRADLIRNLSIEYVAKRQQQVSMSSDEPRLFIVSSGAFEIRSPQGELVDRLDRGGVFGYPTLLTGEAVVNKAVVLEDGLLMSIDGDTFNRLRQQNRAFDRFFVQAHAKRIRVESRFVSKSDSSHFVVTSVMTTDLIHARLQDTVQDCAKRMRDHRVSSLLIMEQQCIKGIVTDKDLRNRVLAEGRSSDSEIQTVMTPNPVTISLKSSVFEASLLMSEHRVHHLPVMDDGRVLGLISSTDIMRNQSSQPLLLVNRINRQHSIEELVKVSQQIPKLLQTLISADTRAEEIGRLLTLITDALTKRLLQIGEAHLGAAPMAYAWLAFGSQGRQDQVAKSDQDNGLLLAKEPTQAEQDYFLRLAKLVCDGLDACGFVHCPGDIMAMNPTWCRSIDSWQQQFYKWIDSPQPKALMHASIFFDMRAIYGASHLCEQLQHAILKRTKGNSIFLAGMAANAVKAKPPLGFFNKFVVERDGKEVKGMDLKHKGNALINDIVRIYALADGICEVNTSARLSKLMNSKLLSPKDALNLTDAQEFIGHLRLANQGRQHRNGEPISNYLQPRDISSLARHQLRDAFDVVHRAQQGIALKFARGMA
ncbi:DUF294 nucleotidyltransferase-like domain-containing protein [Paraferrimonas haliotis]|uniref:Cyclic nucleotide-binding protein n=1 Tax=Paraferrimonas haliotis TaxID=2013866 RepID=A0AA37TNH5_9GAMM|nr:DUF294 nucleotidyltransferase-like domain-containing protein [Paraferrimonas haliotis]GLS82680.1 cyclic nucleotide-binding protein [Paraferrimonas haliotis]